MQLVGGKIQSIDKSNHKKSCSTMNSKRQFVTATTEDIQKLRDSRHEEKTKSSTAWGVKLFKGN